ncbi:isoleucine--tRNA ligase [Mesoplasma lactucae]|uniref:Isoleucine--tRNA ligase n=1 Tax=Mesoplasma lactucae ATCC 49193 TaxID=81460 RepID=A0A291IRQ5_9MOLU|nr:isoleucine--tRNA ligase [Mesoplasma lactucae]ATG97479.1 isoleucine--tRNA ligase [Mesoplasma lactucae ATCC 49193]ATZ20066.1 isoleucyl-tRNA synthetase [Mesoplasma lactucae ATCC 49193]MCL8216814.1 Isoleucine--tRNA ligase [Mesoplasma lactucae ATCC 49193]
MANKYKDTLLIGQTDFSMRAGLGTKEPEIEADWAKNHIYEEKLKLNEGKPLFVLHDGPPYANGNLHIGHAFNKSLKDFIVRWKNSYGYQSPYIMGWDTHGLPIENAVTKSGVNRKGMDPVEFRDLCKEYALKQVANQSEQFRRFGIFTDYSVVYLTLQKEYEMSELRSFESMFNKGLIYKDLKPIYWSPSSESALAESEIEYQDVKSPTIYVACNLVDNDVLPKDTQAIIWTTTPWTLPANQAIAVGPRMEYSVIDVLDKNDEKHQYLVATNLVDKLAQELEWKEVKPVKVVKGSDLEGIKYQHPLYKDKISQIYCGDHVTDEAGTGLVHTASGFGEDDYNLIKKVGLPVFAPLDDQGKFTTEMKDLDPQLVGMFYDDANKVVTKRLEDNKHLLKLKFLTHSYPHDWRTKKPVIYRATLQWFINLRPVKKDILDHVDEISTNPKWAKQRLYDVLEDRTDWLISRQRLWGVPIVGFYDKDKNLVLNSEILKYAIDKIDELGTNAWFSEPADTFLPDNYKNKGLAKEKDILDVWFDSGSSAIALEERFANLKRPFDIYLEGNDQYRGWFNSSMINSVVYDNKSPYKTLISHGMTLDEKGHKMSKSLGNGVDPIQFANTNGSDVFRLWASSTDYTDDQKFGPNIVKQISETYRKIRNTIRFILGNLDDFKVNENYQNTLTGVDKFALFQLSQFKDKVIKGYETYKFNEVYQAVVNYVTIDLSSFYLDFIKDIIYVDAKNSLRRRQVQTVLYEILWALIDALRPILPHTIEEVYTYLNTEETKAKSVHLLDVREQNFDLSAEDLEIWTNVMELRNDINKALEIARENKVINKGFEASVEVEAKSQYEDLEKIPNLATIFILGEIKFVETLSNVTFEGKTAKINVRPKQGEKCERCWGIFDNLHDELCARCYEVVNN